MSVLRGRKIDFVLSIVEGLSPKAAALAAGYAPESAARTARRLMREDPAVADALTNARALKSETLDACRRAAIAKGDAPAAVRASVLLTQLRCGVP